LLLESEEKSMKISRRSDPIHDFKNY